jgi:hypothetical protein
MRRSAGGGREGSKGPAGIGALGAAILAIGVACLPTAGRAGSAHGTDAVVVHGSVSDDKGAPMSGHTVRLLKSRSILNLAGLTRSDQQVEEVRAATDEHGFFEIEFPADPQFRYYYLRFYDPHTFDAVKFALPADLEITRKVRARRPIQASVALKLNPDWPKVKALIDQYGAGSHCGQILRSLGLPSRRIAEGEGRELWEYDGVRTAYLVEGDKVLETRTLDPPAASAEAATASPPEPAVRVEEP